MASPRVIILNTALLELLLKPDAALESAGDAQLAIFYREG
tara:strand:+ start:677 stop:796 length:120 start_codon:yes stop_codon:yes gene_type:complete